ncbi:MAG: glycosyltransferase [Sedimentisphaerales bacterium]
MFEDKADINSILKWRKRNSYYYGWIEKIHKFIVRPNSRILHIGCETGDLLAGLNPSYGLGISASSENIELAKKRFPAIDFQVADPHKFKTNEKFDYIIICNSLGQWHDIQKVFENVRSAATAETRIIVTYYNYLWESVLRLGSFLRLRRPCKYQNWLAQSDIINLLNLADFDVIRQDSYVLLPKRIWPITSICNYLLSLLPGLKHLNLVNLIIARPAAVQIPEKELSVSVIVPCRNEKGNIEDAVKQIPRMGRQTEIIFVDGNSTDGTVEEIEKQIKLHPDRNIKLLHQGQAKGKGDAVRKGFAVAGGDVLTIQDADLTAPPEDQLKFFRVLCQGKGEFINGSRLVYPMEKEAMRLLNLLGNKFFSALFTWILGQRFKDTLCGTKMISRKNYELIAANRAYFGDFDPFGDFDLIFGAVKQNLKVIEIPVNYKARTYGTTNISRFWHGWLLLRMSWIAFKKIKWLGRG